MSPLNLTSPRASSMRLPISNVSSLAQSSTWACSKARRLIRDDRALGEALVLPSLEATVGRRQRFIELGSAHVLEALQQLAGVGVDALVGHGDGSLGVNRRKWAKVLRYQAPQFVRPGSTGLCGRTLSRCVSSIFQIWRLALKNRKNPENFSI